MRGDTAMSATKQLHDLGQSLWLDNITRDLLNSGTLKRYIDELSVTGLTSNPTIYDTEKTVAQAKLLHQKAGRRNLFIKIPGTKEGLPAIEEAIFYGVPVNVTLLFSREQYVAAAEAYMKGLERRVAAGLSPDVRSV